MTGSRQSKFVAELSFTSDFGITILLTDPHRSIYRSELTDALRGADGAAPLGLLVTASDIIASDPALVAASPDWTATQCMSLYSAKPVTEGPVVVEARLVRAGKKVVVIDVTAFDGGGVHDMHEIVAAVDSGELTTAARGTVTFARIPMSAASMGEPYTPGEWVGRVREGAPASVDGNVYARLGVREIDGASGVLEVDRTPFVCNAIGTIMGGVLAMQIEAAATSMVPGGRAADMQLDFLSQVKVGPARTEGTVVRRGADHSVVRVTVTDAGGGGHVLVIAVVTVVHSPV